MNKPKLTLPDKLPARLLFLALGLFLIAFGVALSTKSGLGVSPSASIPYVLCRVTPLSMGMWTTIINLLMVAAQIVLLRRDYRPVQLLQIVVVFLFGSFTDLTIAMVEPLAVSAYPLRLLLCVVSCMIMALGLYLEVKAGLITMSSEGAINAVVKIFHTDFGKTKMALDCTFVAVGCILSLIFLHGIQGVREGTIIAALLVGMCVQRYNKWFAFAERWLNGTPEAAAEIPEGGEAPLVITIEREFGTGGHEIGEALARELDVPFYDYDLIARTAAAAGLTTEEVAHSEEKLPNGLIYTLYNQSFAASRNVSMQDAIFHAQSKIIRELAAKGSCVIVGRLGAYVLKDRPNCFHIFVSANHEFRARRVEKSSNVSYKKALQLVRNEDIARANHCMYFTGAPWGLAKHYALTLDSSKYDIAGSIRTILDALHNRADRSSDAGKN